MIHGGGGQELFLPEDPGIFLLTHSYPGMKTAPELCSLDDFVSFLTLQFFITAKPAIKKNQVFFLLKQPPTPATTKATQKEIVKVGSGPVLP